MRSSSRFLRARSEIGQSSVLAALLCGMLVVLLAMTSNIGTMVTEKIAMQNAIDLSAYSGAATQAAYLNKMREINQQIWQLAFDTRTTFEQSQPPCTTGLNYPNPKCPEMFHDKSSDSNSPNPSCPLRASLPGSFFDAQGPNSADMYAQQQQQAINNLQNQFDQLNQKGYTQAKANARSAADKNYSGLGGLYTGYEGNYGGRMVKTDKTIVDVSYFGYCVFYPLTGPPVIHVAKNTTSPQIPGNNGNGLVAWLYKDEQGDVLFAAKAENAHDVHPWFDFPTPYFMQASDPCWGGNSQQNERCGLNVYAAAAPFYGKLASQDCNSSRPGNSCGGGGSNGNRWNKGNPMQVDQASDLNRDKPKSCGAGGYCDYRVRFVGIFEDEVNYVGNQQQAENNFLPGFVQGNIEH